MTNKHPSLFSPFMLTEKIKLRNRIVMAPMTTWSANPDGTISEQELEFYKRRSQNVGLVITGCTYVTPSGIGFTHEFAAYDDRFINSLEKLAAAAKSGGAPAILQIFHAGNKAIPELVPNNDVISASASSVKSGDFMKRVVQSREMTETKFRKPLEHSEMSQKGRLKQVLMALNFMVRTDSFYRISSPLYLTSVMTDGEEILKDVCASRWPYYRK